jgi:hypothetical protein
MSELLSDRDRLVEIDAWLDDGVALKYDEQPLAQDWARVGKVAEEMGEAIEALIAWTGQNPRKPARPSAREELLTELADTALTAILAIQHFTRDVDETVACVERRLDYLYERMVTAG